MVEEGADESAVEVGQVQAVGHGAGALLGEAEQQTKGVPVGGDGVGTGPPLSQPLQEVALQNGSEEGHGWPSQQRANRSATTAMSSGTASRYQ